MGSVAEITRYASDAPGQTAAAVPAPFPAGKQSAFFELAPVPMMVVSRDMRCVSINDAMAQMLNMPRLPLTGRRVADALPGASKAILQAFDLFRAGGNIQAHEFEHGSKRYELKLGPVVSASDDVTAITVAAIDITRRSRVEQALR